MTTDKSVLGDNSHKHENSKIQVNQWHLTQTMIIYVMSVQEIGLMLYHILNPEST